MYLLLKLKEANYLQGESQQIRGVFTNCRRVIIKQNCKCTWYATVEDYKRLRAVMANLAFQSYLKSCMYTSLQGSNFTQFALSSFAFTQSCPSSLKFLIVAAHLSAKSQRDLLVPYSPLAALYQLSFLFQISYPFYFNY